MCQRGSKVNKAYDRYRDSLGLVCKNGDGGDTCSNQFAILYCETHSPFELTLALSYLVRDGVPLRHPDAKKWYGNVNRTSRDQLIPYLCYIASPNRTAKPAIAKLYFQALAAQHAKRLFLLTWNNRRNFQYPTLAEHLQYSTPDVAWDYSWKLPDICGPDIWACYLRGAMQYWWAARAFYPLLPILDLYLLADTLRIYWQLKVLKRTIGPTHAAKTIDHDKKNTTLLAHQAATHFATPISWLTWKLLKPIARLAARSFYNQPHEPPLYLSIEQLN
jgi:hypothetical protein